MSEPILEVLCAAFDQLSVGVLILSASGRILFANRAANDMLASKAQKLVLMKFVSLKHRLTGPEQLQSCAPSHSMTQSRPSRFSLWKAARQATMVSMGLQRLLD